MFSRRTSFETVTALKNGKRFVLLITVVGSFLAFVSLKLRKYQSITRPALNPKCLFISKLALALVPIPIRADFFCPV